MNNISLIANDQLCDWFEIFQLPENEESRLIKDIPFYYCEIVEEMNKRGL